MRIKWNTIVACGVVALLLAAAGCQPGDEADDADASTAAGDASSGDGSPRADLRGEPSGQTPSGGDDTVGPRMDIPQKHGPPAVLIETSMGKITVELDDEKAPLTVGNFLAYVDKQFYDGTIFHQVFPGAVIVGGMYTPERIEKETDDPVWNEAHNGLKNVPGTIAMARQYNAPDSATSGFFINVKKNPNYDHKPEVRQSYSNPEDYGYCVFGKVTQGMDVVEQIASVEVQDRAPDFEQMPVQTVRINSIQRITR